MSETVDIRELNDLIASKSSFVNMITQGMDQVIVGQKHLVDSLMIGLLSNGDRKSTRLNSSHYQQSRMPSSA